MSVNSILPSSQSKAIRQEESSAYQTKSEKTERNANHEAAIYEESGQMAGNKRLTYTRESVKKTSLLAEEEYNSLQDLVDKLFSTQGLREHQSGGLSYGQINNKYAGNLKDFFASLQVDASTSLKAQQDISEDGYWGVKKTSERIVQFAISLSGGDPSKIAELKEAIEKGYEAAEKRWGGTLPEICMQTKEAALNGLDEWASGLG